MLPQLLFDFRAESGARRRLAFARPNELLVARHPGELIPLLRRAQQLAAGGAWIAGFLGYEAAPGFDRALRVRSAGDLPLAWFGVFDSPRPYRHSGSPTSWEAGPWRIGVEREDYRSRVEALRRAIRDGEIYQANYTVRAKAPFRGDPQAFFERLRAAQPSGYCAFLRLERWSILSVSPELFLRQQGSEITTCPMKGTRRRGSTVGEDEALFRALSASEKDRAENLMIVDLLRNDLSRVAEAGSVAVPELFAVERHPTVLQMTSTITARMKPEKTLADLLASVFPCGSVTGAPKAKAMEWIAELEDEARGVYCGAIGWIAPGGEAVFNVPIRTVVVDHAREEAVCGVGSAITWDSSADDEYDEVLTKLRFLDAAPSAFGLLETMRLEEGAYRLLSRHLDRMKAAAEWFGFAFDREALHEALLDHARRHPTGARRARLISSPTGEAVVESVPLEAVSASPPTVSLALRPVPAGDPRLAFKTTDRQIYEDRLAECPGVWDVILWTGDGQLTEFTRGSLVVELDGRRLTPPLSWAMLPGTFRAELVESGEIHEHILHVSDLARATRLWFVNSVRGWVEVALVERQ